MKKKRLALAAALTGLLLANASWPLPSAAKADVNGTPYVSFVSDKGLHHLEGSRNFTVYLKSTVANDTAFVQFGEGSEIKPLVMKTANSIYSLKSGNLTGGGMMVKIWADENVWFLNIDGAGARDFTVGTAATSLRELRCPNDSLRNFDFLAQLGKLETLVASNNPLVTEVALQMPMLKVLTLERMSGLKKIQLKCEALSEFTLGNSLATSVDLSGSPLLKKVKVLSNPDITTIKLPATAENLAEVTVNGNAKVRTLAYRNYPALKNLQLNSNAALSSVTVTGLPVLQRLNLSADAITSLTLKDLPELFDLNLNNLPLKTLKLDLPKCDTYSYQGCNTLEEMDLTGLPILRTLNITGGKVKRIKLSENAQFNTLQQENLTNNAFTLTSLPPRGRQLNPALNYYAPQQLPAIAKVVRAGQPVDLSAWAYGHVLDAQGQDSLVMSQYQWTTKFDEVLTPGTDYVISGGVTRFLRQMEDSVRCLITNPAFPDFKYSEWKDSKGNLHKSDYRLFTNFTSVLPGTETGAPYLSFTSTQKSGSIYFKTSVAGDTVYMQYGDMPVDTIRLAKADNIVSFSKKGMTGERVPVRIWGSDHLWFVNMGSMGVADVKVGTASTTLRELRCENDSLTDLGFVNDLKALEYLVASNNKKVTEGVFTAPALERLTLKQMRALQTLTLSTPRLQELQVADARFRSVDLGACPELRVLSLENDSLLNDLNVGVCRKLEKISVTYPGSLKSLTLRDMPELNWINLVGCSSLFTLDMGDLPKLGRCNLLGIGLETLEMTGFPECFELTISSSAIHRVRLSLPKCDTFNASSCLRLDSLDLTGLPALRTINANGGAIKSVRFSETALTTSLTQVNLTGNQLTMNAIPPRGPLMNPALNYYAPQLQPSLPKKVFTENTIDMHAWSYGRVRDSQGQDSIVPSQMTWTTKFGEELTPGTDYTVSDGRFVFLREIEDSVCLHVVNTAYPDFKYSEWKDNKGVLHHTDYRIVTNYTRVAKFGGVSDTESDGLAAWTDGLTLHVSAPAASPLSVCASDGTLVATLPASGTAGPVTLRLPVPGLYLVRCGRQARKVLAR